MEWFIQLQKKICDWEWYTDLPTKVLFFHILLKCNYKEANWRWRIVKPWDFITSIEHLTIETGLSRQQVRTAIEKLKRTWEITHYSTNEYTTLTLNNWEVYNQPIASKIANESPTSRQRVATTNNINKVNKEININNKNILVVQEHLKNIPVGTRHTFYLSLIENISLIKFELDDKWIQSIEQKLLSFNKELWLDKSKLELENFWLYHSTNKTVMKSLILRLNTWLNNKIK